MCLVNAARVSKRQDDLGWGITFVDKAAFDGAAPLYEEAYPIFVQSDQFSEYRISILSIN